MGMIMGESFGFTTDSIWFGWPPISYPMRSPVSNHNNYTPVLWVRLKCLEHQNDMVLNLIFLCKIAIYHQHLPLVLYWDFAGGLWFWSFLGMLPRRELLGAANLSHYPCPTPIWISNRCHVAATVDVVRGVPPASPAFGASSCSQSPRVKQPSADTVLPGASSAFDPLSTHGCWYILQNSPIPHYTSHDM